MGLNRWKGRIPNSIKQRAKEDVDKYGVWAYHYACYDTGFGDCPIGLDPVVWEEHKKFDFRLIDCIAKELNARGL